MNHRLPQVLRARLALGMAQRNVVACPIMFHDPWMLDRDVGRALLEVPHRIATRGHHGSQQLIGLRYRPLGIVNEPRLNLLPQKANR